MKAKGDNQEDSEDKEVTPYQKVNHRKVWGCGYYAGVKAAGGDPEKLKLGGNMNQAKAEQLISSLSNTQRKVLDAVPMQTWWTPRQIHSERCRLYSSSAQLKSTSHVLKQLCASKIVREDASGKYQRMPCAVTYPEPIDTPAPAIPVQPMALSKPTPPRKSNVQCINTKKEVEDTAMNLVESIYENIRRTRELLTRIEVDVLALEEQASKKQEDMISLTQLKKLLDGQTNG